MAAGRNSPTNEVLRAPKGVPLSTQVVHTLRDEFRLEKWEVGAQIPTESELCRRFGISRITVRRAMGELEASGVIRRVQGKGTFLLRKPDPGRGSRAATLANHIAYVVPCLKTNPHINVVMDALTRACSRRDYQAVLCSSGLTFESEGTLLARLGQDPFVGACISPHWGFENAESYFELRRSGFPFVLFNLYFREVATDYVAFDHEQIGFEQTRHLIERGHRQIGFMNSLPCSAIEDRHRRYMRALASADLPYYHSLVRELERSQESTSLRNGHQIARDLMAGRRKPTAMVMEGDWAAVGAILALREMGCRVPEDVAVVGSGDDYAEGDAVMPLTTVRFPYEEAVERALDFLLRRIEEPDAPPQRLALRGRLIVRQSSGGDGEAE